MLYACIYTLYLTRIIWFEVSAVTLPFLPLCTQVPLCSVSLHLYLSCCELRCLLAATYPGLLPTTDKGLIMPQLLWESELQRPFPQYWKEVWKEDDSLLLDYLLVG